MQRTRFIYMFTLLVLVMLGACACLSIKLLYPYPPSWRTFTPLPPALPQLPYYTQAVDYITQPDEVVFIGSNTCSAPLADGTTLISSDCDSAGFPKSFMETSTAVIRRMEMQEEHDDWEKSLAAADPETAADPEKHSPTHHSSANVRTSWTYYDPQPSSDAPASLSPSNQLIVISSDGSVTSAATTNVPTSAATTNGKGETSSPTTTIPPTPSSSQPLPTSSFHYEVSGAPNSPNGFSLPNSTSPAPTSPK